jgi:16S rRNA (cytosine967-C5)-methyltransferase
MEIKPAPFKNLVKTTAAALRRVFRDGQHAEMMLEKTLASDSRLGARDRRFIAAGFYDLVRFWRHLEVLRSRIANPDPDDSFQWICLWLTHKGYDLSGWPECTGWDAALLRQEIRGDAATEASVPDWLYQMGAAELGSRWEKEIRALNEPAPIYLRVNTLKSMPEEIPAILASEGIELQPVPGHPAAFCLKDRTNVIRLGSFRKGLYEVQDAASQEIAPFLEAGPGQLLIDACAGAGGKTLHLAALTGDKARIVAMDVEGWKLEELKKRASRAGAKSITTELIRGNKTLKYWAGKADRLLLDVPCSGLGVLRRHPDSKWKLSEESMEEVRETQARILHSYSRMVKRDGKMVYATCSLMPGENEDQVRQFLEEHPEFELEEEKRTWPSEGWDGFYMARMRRKG